MNLILLVVFKIGDREQHVPGRISQGSTNRVDNEGDARSRRDEPGENPMSISGKGNQGRDSRTPAHFAAKSYQWESGNLGADLVTLAALIPY